MSANPSQSECLWLRDGTVWIHVSAFSGYDRISVIEQLAPHGDSPPLHVHRHQDELFHLVEGELSVSLAGDVWTLHAGEFLLIPKGTAHTFRVDTATARWLVTTVGEGLEGFIRALGRPAAHGGLPTMAEAAPEAAGRLAGVAEQHGISIVGPSPL